MPRTSRASQGGYVYHVLNRGNGRNDVFHKADDYLAFVNLMREANERLPMRLVGYCLMKNHFHLLLWPHEDGDLSRWMQWLLTSQVEKGTFYFTEWLSSDIVPKCQERHVHRRVGMSTMSSTGAMGGTMCFTKPTTIWRS